MSLSGILAVGLSGVNAQAAQLETLSDNIANANTTGFRRSRIDFSDRVTAFANGQGSPSVGNSIGTQTRLLASEQGFLRQTDRPTNLAIAGQGFFAVLAPDETDIDLSSVRFTRAGEFSINADGRLVTPDGARVLGAPAGGDTAPSNLSGLAPVDLSGFTGRAFPSTTITLGARFEQAAPASPDALRYNPADPTNNLAGGTITPTLNQSLTIHDSNGAPQTLTAAYLRTGQNTVAIEIIATNTAQTALASGLLVFAPDGTLDQSASTLPTTLDFGDTPIAVELRDSALDIGATRILRAESDGAAFGTVTGYRFDDQGTLIADLSNGRQAELFQIPLSVFTNPEGLSRDGATAFRFDPEAGDLRIGLAGTEEFGRLEASALETSTVDITRAFSTLIETQRAYAANTQVISIADALFETLRDTA